MRIRSKSRASDKAELLDNSGKPLDLHMQSCTIKFEPAEPIVAILEVLVYDIDLLMADITTIINTEGVDITQQLVNEYYIRRHFEYFQGEL